MQIIPFNKRKTNPKEPNDGKQISLRLFHLLNPSYFALKQKFRLSRVFFQTRWKAASVDDTVIKSEEDP